MGFMLFAADSEYADWPPHRADFLLTFKVMQRLCSRLQAQLPSIVQQLEFGVYDHAVRLPGTRRRCGTESSIAGWQRHSR